ncbi:MAG: glycosyl hydrolase family 28-related protein, partial [Lachnospiraceae bacterium]|nr:glycosyl hydrolase family 28-related protein [Lachnospiraceae bacterium]
MNMQCLKTPDSLTFWWEKPELFLNGDSFILEIEGGEMKTLTKTHGTFENLRPGSSYEVSLKFLHAGACADEAFMTVQTENERPVIDVTKTPYFAKGDGETMDRAAIQRAIDDCPAGGTVLLPEGIYRTGALTLKSDMELCLAEGAGSSQRGTVLLCGEPSPSAKTHT